MRCLDLDELERYASADLNDVERRRVCDHLASCPQCRDGLKDVQENLGAVAPVREVLAREVRRRHPRGGARPACAVLPTSIGPYRVLREVGRGGMGIVYEAEQDRPRRVVAIKILKDDFASHDVLRRFEHESQVLGRLQHPGIAQIFAAGTSERNGATQPYFAMELVRGDTILAYAERESLDTRRRLELIARVCDAVQHAHAHGVIHRDLKPANILVDESGQPKVLDFGVARITDSDIKTTTMQTSAGQVLGTIAYMSPEQVTGEVRHVDVRSDVYSLGVVAYELLAGRLPYELSHQMIPDAMRTILDDDPVSLSSVDRAFRGDVETIVAKALEKDKARRYPSAAALAADIRRHLRDEPIVARPMSALYQLRKFARRNRALVVGVAAVFAVLILGASVSAWQAVRATRAERMAQRRLLQAREAQALAEARHEEATNEAAKYAAVNTFLEDMLASVNPEVSPGDRQVTVAEVLQRAVAQITEGSLGSQPGIEAAVRTTIGNTFRALGDYAAAEPHLRAAVAIGRRLHPEGSEDLAYSLNKLARLLQEQGNFQEAETLFRETLAMRRELLGGEHTDVAVILNNLGWLLDEKGEYDEAETLHREALAMRRKLFGNEHSEVATSLNNLAVLLHDKGDLATAESFLRESLAIDRKLRGDRHPNVASTRSNLGLVLMDEGRYEEAEVLLRDGLALRQELLGESHPQTLASLYHVAGLCMALDQYDRAEPLLAAAVNGARQVFPEGHRRISQFLTRYGMCLTKLERYDEAEPLLLKAQNLVERDAGRAHEDTAEAAAALAELYQSSGRPDSAAAWRTKLPSGSRTSKSPTLVHNPGSPD